ncbi:MAG TPA: sigma-70 family RNA polymerase sigma factor [Gaiellaceae bacterium]|nr:sigma-70 family RNA polymerase sigma factor [Gaiellaceae bacterium]
MDLALDHPRLRALPEPQAAPLRTDDVPDGELLVRVAERDRAAFETIYQRYVRSVYGLALRRLRDRQRAEDAVQETFAAVWRSAGSYKPERGPAAPWLYAIARNAIVDRFRMRIEPVAETPEIVSGEPGPADRAEADFVSWRVHRALEELSEKEREVVELAYWSGLSQSEVAEYLHIPLGTVKTRTRSALARLADLLEGELQ